MRIELEKVQADQVFWDCGAHGNVRLKALENAHEVGEGRWAFRAIDNSGTVHFYMLLQSMPHYGPQLYGAPAYITKNEQAETGGAE